MATEKDKIAKETSESTKKTTKKNTELDLSSVLEEMKKLSETVAKLSEENDRLKATAVANSRVSDFDRWVTIVHLVQRSYPLTTDVKMTDGKHIVFRNLGDEASMRYNDFEELIRLHRDLFDENILCLSEKDEDLVEKFHIKTKGSFSLTPRILNTIYALSEDEIKRIYSKVCKSQKDTITQNYIASYFEKDENGNYPKNPKYNNKKIISLLNELSDGAMEVVLEDMEHKKRVRK